MITGYVGVTIAPPSPWHEIVAVFFGIGMGLALDEFALWLDLKDVYWAEQGRKSIDAMIIAAAISRDASWSGSPPGSTSPTEVEDVVFALVGAFGLVGHRGHGRERCEAEVRDGRLGFLIPGRSGSWRRSGSAKPHSLWASLFYSDEKKARADARFHGRRRRPGSPPKQDARVRSVGRRLRLRSRSGAVAVLTSPDVSGAASVSSMISTPMRAAVGIARSAPSMPASSAPDEDRDDRDRGMDLDGALVEERLDHAVLELLVDDEQDRPDDQRLREVVERGHDRDEHAADREADQRHQVEERRR